MFRGLFSSTSSSSQSSSSPSEGVAALRELLENMIRALVDEPGKIELSEASQDDDAVLFELRVSKSDLGKVIGKKGRTASAMRTILSAASRKYRLSADLKILD